MVNLIATLVRGPAERKTAAGLMAVGFLVLTLAGQFAREEAEAQQPDPSGSRVQFVTAAEELPPAALQQARPSPAPPGNLLPQPKPPRPAPAGESVLPDTPRTLAEDEAGIAAGQLELPPIQSLSVNIRPSAGDLPENMAATMFDKLPTVIAPPGQPATMPHYTGWPRISGVCYHPLYFEEEDAERYGIVRPLQPVRSAAHFFGTVPLMPFKLAQQPPRSRVCSDARYPNANHQWLMQYPILRTIVVDGEAGLYTASFLLP